MKKLKRILALVMCICIMTTAVPVSGYDGPICKKHNYIMTITEFGGYDAAYHYYNRGRCSKCGAWKTRGSKIKHRFISSGAEYLTTKNANFEEYTRYRKCSIANETIKTTRRSSHAYRCTTTVKNTRAQLLKVYTYTCVHLKCKYSYTKSVTLHKHNYTKNGRGGKCRICGRNWI